SWPDSPSSAWASDRHSRTFRREWIAAVCAPSFGACFPLRCLKNAKGVLVAAQHRRIDLPHQQPAAGPVCRVGPLRDRENGFRARCAEIALAVYPGTRRIAGAVLGAATDTATDIAFAIVTELARRGNSFSRAHTGSKSNSSSSPARIMLAIPGK